jgi:hypothetical protein
MSIEWNRRLVAVARGIMGTWARKAVAARRDYTQKEYGADCLRRAVEWREKARRWKECPV